MAVLICSPMITRQPISQSTDSTWTAMRHIGCSSLFKSNLNRKGSRAMLLSKKIKLEVSVQDAEALEFMQAKCRGLYNWWIMRLRTGEDWPGWRQAKAT